MCVCVHVQVLSLPPELRTGLPGQQPGPRHQARWLQAADMVSVGPPWGLMTQEEAQCGQPAVGARAGLQGGAGTLGRAGGGTGLVPRGGRPDRPALDPRQQPAASSLVWNGPGWGPGQPELLSVGLLSFLSCSIFVLVPVFPGVEPSPRRQQVSLMSLPGLPCSSPFRFRPLHPLTFARDRTSPSFS